MPEALFRLEKTDFHPAGVSILKELDLEVQAGACTVFMGASGSGKSSLLKILAGIVLPSHGRVWFDGQKYNSLSENALADLKGRMGFQFQDGALWANKTLFQNIELPLIFHNPKMSARDVERRIHDLCARVGYSGYLKNRPSQISLGEQKVISLLRALVNDPPILLLDDPTGSLDPQTQEKVTNLLVDLKKAGKTILMVSQEAALISKLCDTLVLLRSGKILVQGPFSEVRKNPDPHVKEILTSVLSQAASYDDDILNLISGSDNLGF